MTPDIILVDSKIKYRNKLKNYLLDKGFENISTASGIYEVRSYLTGSADILVIASGDEVFYSDLIRVTCGELCAKVRFLLTYSGVVSADVGLARLARSIKAVDDLEYISDVVKEEIENYFSQTDEKYSQTDFVAEKLDCLGLRSTHNGYKYITHAAGMSGTEMVTKDVYPDIARKYKTTSCAVERSIRSAVSYAWARGGYARFNKHIGWTGTKCPTNGEFIAALAVILRLEGSKHAVGAV